MDEIRILPAGDRALTVDFGNVIDPAVNDRVQALAKKLADASPAGVIEYTPTFRSLLVFYDPSVLGFEALKARLLSLAQNTNASSSASKRLFKIPCCYGGHFGPDLADMEKHTGLTRDEIVAIHSGVNYRIYMLGFLPGFVYLGGLDPKIAMPRLSTPRLKIPKGAVGIGGNQTGVYPLESPGGWRLIGGTPLDFYDPDREEPVLCKAGDYIRFVPVSACDYYDIRQEMLRGTYHTEIEAVTE